MTKFDEIIESLSVVFKIPKKLYGIIKKKQAKELSDVSLFTHRSPWYMLQVISLSVCGQVIRNLSW